MLALLSEPMNLQYGNLSKSMSQGGTETMAGRWRGMLGRLGARDALGQSYSRLS
jgi:hypothetical protein